MRGIYLTALFLIAFGIMFAGCGNKPVAQRPEDKQVIAKIDDYELTISDFKDEAGPALAKRRDTADPLKLKKELLEDLIMKKILIKEAQKENFDKEKVFMKEIERYWEQALLKSLVKKKIEELSLTIGIDKENVAIEKALEDWMAALRNKANVKIDEEALKKIDLK